MVLENSRVLKVEDQTSYLHSLLDAAAEARRGSCVARGVRYVGGHQVAGPGTLQRTEASETLRIALVR